MVGRNLARPIIVYNERSARTRLYGERKETPHA